MPEATDMELLAVTGAIKKTDCEQNRRDDIYGPTRKFTVFDALILILAVGFSAFSLVCFFEG